MISWPKLIILLAVIILIFGTKRLRTLGSDLGSAIKGFKNAMNDDENKASDKKDAEFLNDSEVNASQNTTNSDKKE